MFFAELHVQKNYKTAELKSFSEIQIICAQKWYSSRKLVKQVYKQWKSYLKRASSVKMKEKSDVN